MLIREDFFKFIKKTPHKKTHLSLFITNECSDAIWSFERDELRVIWCCDEVTWLATSTDNHISGSTWTEEIITCRKRTKCRGRLFSTRPQLLKQRVRENGCKEKTSIMCQALQADARPQGWLLGG